MPAPPDTGPRDGEFPAGNGMRVVTLGTGGGPVVSQGRAGISTLVTVDGAAYVVDCGMGSVRNYRAAAGWEQLRAVFLTHLHSDHIYDLGAFLVTGWQVPGESFARPVEVVGPAAPSRFPAEDDARAQRIDAVCGNRKPSGTRDVVAALLEGVYGPDVTVRMADEGRSAPEEWIRPRDIAIPEHAGADPVTCRHPPVEPFEVYADDLVRVTATLVDHRLCSPAFAFRFDSAHGSVVISGDTAVSDNLIALARGADLLVHEVIDLDAMLATLPAGPKREGIARHLRESHTPHTAVGGVARQAEVRRLVLSHVVPNHLDAVDPRRLVATARETFPGPVAVARDLDTFEVR